MASSRGALRITALTPIGVSVLVTLSCMTCATAAERSDADRMIKSYVGKSRAACDVIDYRCPDGIEAFEDANGCGCLFPAEQNNPPPKESAPAKSKK
jgi:hypothetical protein